MSEIPALLQYVKTHEWVKREEDNLVRVGITDFAQTKLGDLVFIQLPKVGQHFDAGQQCAVVESVKAASDLFAPVAGVIVEVNSLVCDEPELVNDAPYQNWLFCLKADQAIDLTQLLDAKAYQALISQ